MNDPCIHPSMYPYKEIESHDKVLMGVTQNGGHCGYFTGTIFPY